MIKAEYFLTGGLLLATIVVILIGQLGITSTKLVGAALSMVAFLPVFLILQRVLKQESVTQTLAVFVGGFFFKLVVLLVGVWFFVAKMNFDPLEFVVSSMVFLIVLQVYESVFFWTKQGK